MFLACFFFSHWISSKQNKKNMAAKHEQHANQKSKSKQTVTNTWNAHTQCKIERVRARLFLTHVCARVRVRTYVLNFIFVCFHTHTNFSPNHLNNLINSEMQTIYLFQFFALDFIFTFLQCTESERKKKMGEKKLDWKHFIMCNVHGVNCATLENIYFFHSFFFRYFANALTHHRHIEITQNR